MMATFTSSAGVSFLFWVIAARLYSPEEIGVSTALISSMTLLVVLSRLGLDQSLIRFFPERGSDGVVGTCTVVTTILSAFLALVFVLISGSLIPELRLATGEGVLFISFLLLASITNILGTTFLALRKAELYLYQSIFLDSRLLFLVPLLQFGAIGVFSSVGISFVLGASFSLYTLFKSHARLFYVDWHFLRESLRFSVGNYMIGLLMASPAYLLPLVVLSQLGPADTGSYYIAYAIASMILIVPTAFSTSLYVEGSHGAVLLTNARRTLRAVFLLLIPLVVVLCTFGDDLLRLFGDQYIGAFHLLQLMAISYLFFSILSIYYSIKRVQKDIRTLVSLSLLSFVLIIGLSFLFMRPFGIVGIGYAWLVSYGSTASVIGVLAKLEKWI